MRQWRSIIDQHFGGARRGFKHLGDVVADAAQFIEIVAVYFRRKLAVRLKNLVLDAVEDGLAEGKFVPGKLSEPRPHAADEIVLGLSRRPGVVGVKYDKHFEMRGGIGIGALVIAADMIYGG